MQYMDPSGVEERLQKHLDKGPSIDPTAFVHPRSVVEGDVTLGPSASVWPCAVLRGDINSIEIGEGSNVQDNAMVHLSDDYGVKVGKYVTIGHMAMIHACTIEDECLIGMNAIILDGAKIGKQSIIGAGALVKEGMEVPEGSLVVGCPGKVIRVLDQKVRDSIKNWALKYTNVAAGFKKRHEA